MVLGMHTKMSSQILKVTRQSRKCITTYMKTEYTNSTLKALLTGTLHIDFFNILYFFVVIFPVHCILEPFL